MPPPHAHLVKTHRFRREEITTKFIREPVDVDDTVPVELYSRPVDGDDTVPVELYSRPVDGDDTVPVELYSRPYERLEIQAYSSPYEKIEIEMDIDLDFEEDADASCISASSNLAADVTDLVAPAPSRAFRLVLAISILCGTFALGLGLAVWVL